MLGAPTQLANDMLSQKPTDMETCLYVFWTLSCKPIMHSQAIDYKLTLVGRQPNIFSLLFTSFYAFV